MRLAITLQLEPCLAITLQLEPGHPGPFYTNRVIFIHSSSKSLKYFEAKVRFWLVGFLDTLYLHPKF